MRRVVLGSVDPNPSVDGGGKAFLVDNGIEVEVMDGEEAQMAAALITDFWERMKVGPKTPINCNLSKIRYALSDASLAPSWTWACAHEAPGSHLLCCLWVVVCRHVLAKASPCSL